MSHSQSILQHIFKNYHWKKNYAYRALINQSIIDHTHTHSHTTHIQTQTHTHKYGLSEL